MLGREVDLIEPSAIERNRNYIRRVACTRTLFSKPSRSSARPRPVSAGTDRCAPVFHGRNHRNAESSRTCPFRGGPEACMEDRTTEYPPSHLPHRTLVPPEAV